MKNIIIAIIISVALVFSASLMSPRANLGSIDINQFSSATEGTDEIGTSASELLSGYSGRQYVQICAVDSMNLFLHYNSTSTSVAVNEGILLTQGDCHTISPQVNMYRGAIWAIASATGTVSYLEAK